jgi:hypothetical protein
MRFFLIFFGVLFMLSALSGVNRVRSTSGGLARIHPAAISVVLGVSATASATGHGVATKKGVTAAANAVRSVAVMENLGMVAGHPRLVKYQLWSYGSWVQVCVVLPKHDTAYPVVCPS